MNEEIKDQIKDATDGEQSAFPYSIRLTNKTEQIHMEPGMTLRDYFAAKAIQGLYAASPERANHIPGYWAKDAYKIADVMMKAREEGKELS